METTAQRNMKFKANPKQNQSFPTSIPNTNFLFRDSFHTKEKAKKNTNKPLDLA